MLGWEGMGMRLAQLHKCRTGRYKTTNSDPAIKLSNWLLDHKCLKMAREITSRKQIFCLPEHAISRVSDLDMRMAQSLITDTQLITVITHYMSRARLVHYTSLFLGAICSQCTADRGGGSAFQTAVTASSDLQYCDVAVPQQAHHLSDFLQHSPQWFYSRAGYYYLQRPPQAHGTSLATTANPCSHSGTAD